MAAIREEMPPRLCLALSGSLKNVHCWVNHFRHLLPAVILGLDTAVASGEVARIGLAEFVSMIILDARLGTTPIRWASKIMRAARHVADAVTISFNLPPTQIFNFLKSRKVNINYPNLVAAGIDYLPIVDYDQAAFLISKGIKYVIIPERLYCRLVKEFPEVSYIVTTDRILCCPPSVARRQITHDWILSLRSDDMMLIGPKNIGGPLEAVADYWVDQYCRMRDEAIRNSMRLV